GCATRIHTLPWKLERRCQSHGTGQEERREKATDRSYVDEEANLANDGSERGIGERSHTCLHSTGPCGSPGTATCRWFLIVDSRRGDRQRGLLQLPRWQFGPAFTRTTGARTATFHSALVAALESYSPGQRWSAHVG